MTHKPRRFLGKIAPAQAPRQQNAQRAPRSASSVWSLFFLLPVVLGAVLITQPTFNSSENNQNTSPRSGELRDSSGPLNRTLGANPVVPAVGVCERLLNDIKAAPLFPFIPDVLLSKDPTGCRPAVWSRSVILFLLYRGLALLNWFAAGLAIILTVVAGLYYMAGFANENTVKTGKKFLVGVYVGVAIILFAQLLVRATFSALNPGRVEDAISEQLNN